MPLPSVYFLSASLASVPEGFFSQWVVLNSLSSRVEFLAVCTISNNLHSCQGSTSVFDFSVSNSRCHLLDSNLLRSFHHLLIESLFIS